ncbi:MAG: nucleotide exchange factor GrpE [Anaerolineaceae bacterium 4572_5.1]|nr:MAG: nucleotide exchange factor GrpE [Anaerolineaceae bacterium 4572_5.1]RLD08408.1 MAG: nucleotide exchange factor GrpE [Chloroflexota bacterium]
MKKKETVKQEEVLTPQEGDALEETATTPEGESAPPQGDEIPAEVDEISALQAALKECVSKQHEYLDGWQRSRAEFTNYKKRIARENERVYQTAKGNIVKGYLDVLDDLERALNNCPLEGEGADWADGIELIYQKLQSKLEAEGIKPMKAEGEKFDPNLHEALVQEENAEYESGCVIEEVEKGYYLGDRVLRLAKVRVAA